MNTAPPPLPLHASSSAKAKPFYLPSIVIAAVGALPLLVYLLMCIGHIDSAYRTGGISLRIIVMGFIGFVLHGIGLACGVVGIFKGGRTPAYIGSILNALIILAVFVLGFLAIAMG